MSKKFTISEVQKEYEKELNLLTPEQRQAVEEGRDPQDCTQPSKFVRVRILGRLVKQMQSENARTSQYS